MLENSSRTSQLDVLNVTRKITSSDAWKEARVKVEHFPIPEKDKQPTAVRLAAVALRGKEEGDYLTLHEHTLNITAHLATFEDTIKKLERLRHHDARREQKEPYIRKAIAFNNAIKDMVDANSSLKYNEVVLFLREMNQKIHGPHEDSLFKKQVHELLQGVRNELAVEQMAPYLNGIEMKPGTQNQDLKGIDYFFREAGGGEDDWVPTDIKATEFTADKARDSAEDAGVDSSYIIWSQLKPEDFNNGFHISPELAKQKAPALEREIRYAIAAKKHLDKAS